MMEIVWPRSVRRQSAGAQKLGSPSPERGSDGGSERGPEKKLRKKYIWLVATLLALTMILALVFGLVFGLQAAHARAFRNGTTGGSGNSGIGEGQVKVNTTVDLGYAKYIGTDLGNGTSTWYGIKYASNPVGDLRFRAPADPPNTGDTITADTHGPVCLGTPSRTINPAHSEDCLYLDIYAPSAVSSTASKANPVFVFFSGGGFNTISNPNIDGTNLAGRGIVVVTFNYRVGVFGFLASKEVQADGNLNVGLLDQRKVLQWVQENIHLFGGNPNHVIIGGDSAGGASVDLHLSAYGGRDDGLFHGAAAESQSFGAQFTVSESQYQYDALIARLGCKDKDNTLGCLRGLSAIDIATNNTNIPTPGGGTQPPLYMYSNVIDGTFTQDYTYNAFASGKFINVPVIFGDDTNEGTEFTPYNVDTQDDMKSFLKDNFIKLNSSQLSTIATMYPKAEQFPGKGAYWRAAANAYGEMRYICPGIYLSQIYAAKGNSSWNYHWDVLLPKNAINGLGVTHTAELYSIWGLSTGDASALIPTIQDYWVSFIKNLDPNAEKLSTAPTWAPYTASGMQRVHFPNDPNNTSMETVPSEQMQRCKWLWEQGAGLEQ